ncbi:ABSCISIC ACID-INSENSITIVE 5-like protein 2 isoform X2 [Spinacia oleracea]|uniref:ABSCISIC ACID-INSENSITIVE 5-like protein 2 isoform X2 n=1 Tax=Spinacia oleracea TaxID=3562 RepID=A0ABM3RV92_SPIOL|nr:ABSCISIC ACID-INSENSITIVE 5-like protein 2 isoform X2 [Spinacia oleracea]
MNIDEFIKNDWNPEIHQPSGIKRRNDGSSIKSLQSQGSLQLSRTASEKVVDDVWREIQQEDRIKSTSSSSQGVKREPSIGEMTLEDFLAKAEAIDESALDPVMPLPLPLPLDMDATVRCFSQQMGLSPAPSIRGLSDTFERKRDNPGTMERGFEKRLKRKIKNRESAARSRARKQAYHNELVTKVSLLEEQNMRLKKDKILAPNSGKLFLRNWRAVFLGKWLLNPSINYEEPVQHFSEESVKIL